MSHVYIVPNAFNTTINMEAESINLDQTAPTYEMKVIVCTIGFQKTRKVDMVYDACLNGEEMVKKCAAT